MTAGGPGEGGSEVLSVGGSCASEGTAGRRGGQEQTVGRSRRQLRNLGLSLQVR